MLHSRQRLHTRTSTLQKVVKLDWNLKATFSITLWTSITYLQFDITLEVVHLGADFLVSSVAVLQFGLRHTDALKRRLLLLVIRITGCHGSTVLSFVLVIHLKHIHTVLKIFALLEKAAKPHDIWKVPTLQAHASLRSARVGQDSWSQKLNDKSVSCTHF